MRFADARVAALVGYDNLVDATVQPDGAVLVGGAPTGLVHRPTATWTRRAQRRWPCSQQVFGLPIPKESVCRSESPG